ncbi:hypothetical protein O3P69_015712 [Scylla paramamosain]|uniref:SMB domain-containing protein n=1 Tax=Scylla paramamosain TaxID=85552 RepID=A0AAW0SA07_SCYPA
MQKPSATNSSSSGDEDYIMLHRSGSVVNSLHTSNITSWSATRVYHVSIFQPPSPTPSYKTDTASEATRPSRKPRHKDQETLPLGSLDKAQEACRECLHPCRYVGPALILLPTNDAPVFPLTLATPHGALCFSTVKCRVVVCRDCMVVARSQGENHKVLDTLDSLATLRSEAVTMLRHYTILDTKPRLPHDSWLRWDSFELFRGGPAVDQMAQTLSITCGARENSHIAGGSHTVQYLHVIANCHYFPQAPAVLLLFDSLWRRDYTAPTLTPAVMWAGSVVVVVVAVAVLALGASLPNPRPPFLCPSPHDNTGHDGTRHSSTSSTTTPFEEHVCVQYTSRHGTLEGQALMIASCGATWEDNEEVQEQCLRGTAIPHAFMGVPYTNPFNGRTYVNAYCAICNGEDPTWLNKWLFSVVCEDARRPLDRPDHHGSVDHDSVDYSTVYFSNGTWGVILPGVNVSASVPCHTAITKPSHVVHPGHWAPYQSHHSTRPLTLLLSVSLQRCGPEEVRDQMSDRCTKVICPRPDEKFCNGRCVTMPQGAAVSTQGAAISMQDTAAPYCPIRHSCAAPRVSNRGCRCDASCREYGDCCRDSQHYDKVQQIKNFASHTCVPGSTPVYAKTKCSEGWGDEEVQALCLMGNKTPGGSASLFPVTSTTTAHTYINHYCAICNGEDPAQLRVWLARFECTDWLLRNCPPDDENISIVFRDSDSGEGSWGIMLPSCGPSSFRPCSLTFVVPEDMKNYTRECDPELVATCGPEAQEHQRVLCQSYAATVYQDSHAFRNQHCASCNGYEEYRCVWTKSKMPADGVSGFLMLLDSSNYNGSNFIGFTCWCGDEVWDRQFGTHRKIFCSAASPPTSAPSDVYHARMALAARTSTTMGPGTAAGTRHSNTSSTTRPLKEHVCVQYTSVEGTHEGYAFMIASCGAAWQDSEEVQAQCLRGTAIPDAFMGVPYTNTSTNRIYVNAYCAICNGEDPTRLYEWLFFVVCEDKRHVLERPDGYYSLHQYSIDYGSMDYSNVDYDIVFFSNGTWGVILPGVNISASFPCHTIIADPMMPHAPSPPHHSTPQLILLLSVNLQQCGPEEILQLKSDRCIKVICPLPDEKFRNTRCVTVSQGAAVSTQGAVITTHGTTAPYCPIRHSCAVPRVSDRGCRCDASCREYGDCCRDSHYYDEAQQMKNFVLHTCVAGPTPVYAKTKCSVNWSDEEVQALCLMGNKTPGGTASLFPVTSTTTAHTYINHYCAICNGEDPDQLRVWLARLECTAPWPLLNCPPDDEHYSIVFRDSDSGEGSWGIMLPSCGLSSFRPCSLTFVVPEDMKNYTRECDPELVASCGPQVQEHQRVLCQSYAATVYQGSHAFRNQHCASCNGHEEYRCVPGYLWWVSHHTSGWLPRPEYQFTMLLDSSSYNGSNFVGFTCQCGGRVWDRQFDTYREMFCSATSPPTFAPSDVYHARMPPPLHHHIPAQAGFADTPTWPGTAAGTSTTKGPGTADRTSTTTGPGTTIRTSTTTVPGTAARTSTTTGPGTAARTSTTTGPGTAAKTSTATGLGTAARTSTDTGPDTAARKSTATGLGTDARTSTATEPDIPARTSTITKPGTAARTSTTTGTGTAAGTSAATGPSTAADTSTTTGPGTASRTNSATGPGTAAGTRHSSTSSTTRPLNEHMCLQYASRKGTHEGYAFMIASCGAVWQDSEVHAQCLRSTAIPDALMGVPYTNTSTNHIYVNAYCAICNGEDPTRLHEWLFVVVCEDTRRALDRPDDYYSLYYNNMAYGIMDYSNEDYDIVYFSNGTWGVILPGVNVSASLPCHTAIAKPSHILNPGHWVPRQSHHSTQPLTLLLSVNLQRCGPEEVRDQMSDRCTKVICPHPDRKFRYGRCVTVSQGAAVSTQGGAISTQGTTAPYCPIHHSCAVSQLSHRGCCCDASCREYGDCCRDSHHYDEAQQMKNFALHTCVPGPTPAYAKIKCSEGWGDEEVQALCLMGNKTPGGSASLFPVTSTTTAHTYINHYCAICNGEDPAQLRVWLARFECTDWLLRNCPPDDENISIVFRDSDSGEGSWGIMLPSCGPSSFRPCSLTFVVPEDMKNYTRECDPELVATCGPEAQEHQRVLCQSYAATVYQDSHAFRNQHCASCNGYEEYRCVWTKSKMPADGVSGFLMLLDSSNYNGSNFIGFTCRCGDEVWDRQFGTHGKIFCSAASPPTSAPSDVYHARIAPPLHHHITAQAGSADTPTGPGTAARTSTTMGPGTAAGTRHNGTSSTTRPLKEHVCVQYTSVEGTHEGYAFMIASCEEAWQDSEEVQAQCLRGTAIPDAFMGVPYTNTSTNRIYVNAYCAICNGEDPTRLYEWLFFVVCEDKRHVLERPDGYYSLHQYSIDYGSMDYSNVDYDIVFFSNGTWGVILPGVNISASFPCHTIIADPMMPHAPSPPHHSTPQLILLLSVNLQQCGPEEILQLKSDRCIKVICPLPDEKFRNGRCVTVPQGAAVCTQGGAISTQGTTAPYCPIHHSCAVSQLSHRGCRCDASCREYGDCCRDSHHYDEAQQKKNFASHTCVAGPTPVYMKTKCSEDWDDEEVQALCLMGNKTPGGSARLFPVTSTTTAHTYINYYCAVCNGEDPAQLRVWLARLECVTNSFLMKCPPGYEDYSIVFRDSDSGEGSWGIMMPSCGPSSFRPCSLIFLVPEDMKKYTRECDLHLVSTCGPEAQEHQRVLCQSYAAVVYLRYRAFRNQHCASCNGHEQYGCVPGYPWKEYESLEAFEPTYGFVTLLDISDHSGSNIVGFTDQCGGEVSERRSNMSLKVFCSMSAVSPPTTSLSSVYQPRMPLRTSVVKPFFRSVDTPTGPGTAAGTSTTTGPGTAPETSTTTGPGTAARTSTAMWPGTAAGTNTLQAAPTRGDAAGEGLCDSPRVLLNEAEFIRQTDGSWHVPAQGRTYHAGEYEGAEGDVLVCLSAHKFSAALAWVSTVGLSLSCLALALHLAAFCVAPSLRNLAGKCLASLCVALLAACAAVLASAPRGAGCVVLAIAKYYFWLCCFAWMTAMAQDVWRAFRLSHTQLRVAGGAETRRFLVYSLCCWLVPAACVALVVALDQLEPRGLPEAFLPRLGHPWCWFSHRKSLLVFFAAPVAVFIAMNVVFFTSTAVLIAGVSRGAAMAATASASLRRQRYCSVVRLAVVMGLAWVTAILAPYLQWEPLLYLSAILTSLQGVFIFLAFTCKATVLQEVRAQAPALLQRTATLITRHPPPPVPAVALDHLHSDQDVSSSTL